MDPVGHLEHVGRVVADQDHRQTLLLDLANQLEHLTRLLDSQGGRRFVQDHELGGESRRAGHRHRLTLATRQRFDCLRHVLHRGDAEVRHGRARVHLHALLVEHPQDRPNGPLRRRSPTEVHVGRDVQGRRHRQRLVDGLDAGVAGVLRAAEVHFLPVDEHLSGVGDQRPGHGLDQRRLAGAVVTDHRERLGRVQVHVDAVEPDDLAEGLDQPSGRQHRGAGVDKITGRAAVLLL